MLDVSLNFGTASGFLDTNKWMWIMVSLCSRIFAELMKVQRALSVW